MAIPKQFRINLRLLPVKATYFFTLAAVASLLPYLPVYMKQVGLSQTEAGIIYGTTPFIGALVRPVFGAIADKYNKHKFVLMLCVILTGILHACLSALPHHPVSTEVYNSSQVMVNMQCGTADSHIEFCPVDSLSHMGCTYEQKHPVSAHSREHLSGQVFTKYNSSSENDSYHELYNITYTTGKEFDPLENLRNCSFRCRFDDPGQSHSVCVKNSQNDSAQPVCPLTKAQDKKLGASIGHGIDPKALKNFFEMSIFVEHLFKIGTKNSDNPEKECYKYVANHFDYHNRAFDQDWVLYCDSKTSLTCRMDCHESPLNFTALDEFNCPKQTPENPKYGRIFWMFFLLFLMAQIFFAPVFTLIDGVVYSYLGEDRRFWGKSRLFGTVGYIVLGVTSGLIMDVYVGDDGTKNYTVAFVLFPVLNFIAAVMVCLFQLSDDVKCGQIFDNMLGLFKDIQVLTLLVIVLVFGIDNGVIETFLFWHLQDAGASQLLLGLCMMMNCILEIFILFFASVILKKIGHINCFYIVFTAYFLRLLSYSFLTNPWFALLIEPLHSITFGLFYATATSHGSIITPPGMHGTVQGLIGGMFFGIGKGIGGVSGGKIFNTVGAHAMFRGFAIATAVMAVLYVLLQCTILKKRSPYTQSPTHEARPVTISDKHRLSSTGSRSLNGLSLPLEEEEAQFSKDKEMLVFKDSTEVNT